MPAFLSDDWFSALEGAASELEDTPSAVQSKINFVVTETPFDDDVNAHLDTSDGLEFGQGHMDDGAVTITLPYEVAEKILVKGDAAAGMQAFMGGQMQIAGDMMQAMQLQTAMSGSDSAKFREVLESITG